MRRIVLTAGLVALVCAQHTAYGEPSLGCGPNARLANGVITVRPSGGDDSATLQCVLDRAAALHVRQISLTAGTFHAVSVVANDFHGHLSGEGENRTIIENPAEPAYVTPQDFLLTLPGPDNPWASMVVFVGGKFAVSRLSLKVTGIPTTGWSIFGIEPPIEALAHGFVIVGAEAHAVFEHVTIEGEKLPSDLLFGYNLYNGIYFEGTVAPGLPTGTPLKGSFVVRNSTFRNVADGTPSSNLSDADVMILGNVYSGVLVGADTDDLVRSSYLFARNRIVDAAWYGFMHYDIGLPFPAANAGSHNSSVSVLGNDFGSSAEGVLIDGTLGRSNRCLVAGNDVSAVADMAVFLGTGTAGCHVVSGGNVVDLGTDNHVVQPR